MSQIKQSNDDDYPEAAGKHLVDALALLDAGHADGAAYLSGYVVECALKSVVILEAGRLTVNRKQLHDLGTLSREALRLAALPGARTARYAPRMTPGHSLYARVSGWQPQIRYRAPGAVAPADAAAWVAEAAAVFESTVLPMRMDGVV